VKKLLLVISLFALTLSSCKKEIVACVELDTNSTSAGSPIVFTSCSENSLSYIWNFSGPVGAPENNMQRSEPKFDMSFTVPGTYTVELIAYKRYSWIGDQSTTTATFTIN